MEKFSQPKVWVDNLFIRLASECVNRKIVLYSMIPDDVPLEIGPTEVAGNHEPFTILVFKAQLSTSRMNLNRLLGFQFHVFMSRERLKYEKILG